MIIYICNFNVHGSVHRNNILIQKSQQNAYVTEIILFEDCSTCFGYHYHPSSGAQNNCKYSIWSCHHNGNLITEQSTGEQNPLFQLATDIMLTSATKWKKKQINTPPTTHSNWFQIFHDSSRQQYGVTVTRCCIYSCFVLLKMGDSNARNI